MIEFKKEHRYYVFKRKNLTKNMADHIRPLTDNIWCPECVVVESDWPEYEIVWSMIQARVEGKPTIIMELQAENAATLVTLSDARGRNRDLLSRATSAEAERDALIKAARKVVAARDNDNRPHAGDLFPVDLPDAIEGMAALLPPVPSTPTKDEKQ